MPHEVGVPVQLGAGAGLPMPAVAAAKVENFFASFVEPQCGHFVPSQSRARTRISLSHSHFPQ